MSFAKILPLLIAAAPVALATPALAQSAAPTGPAAGITTQLPHGAVPSHYTIEVGNNANVNIQVNKGDVNVVTKEGNINMKSGRSVRIDAEQEIRLKARSFKAEIDTTWDELVQGANTKTGKTIDLN